MSIFSDISRRYSDRVAAINEAGDALTYQELGEFSARIGKLVDKRTVVCCLCENTIAAMSGYVAFVENKIVPIMVDGAIDKEFLRNICTIYDPEYIWLSSDRTDLTANRDIVFSFGNYSLIKMGGSARFPLHDDLAVLLSTSGSTGSPKFVRLSYTNLKVNADSIAKCLEIYDLDRPVTTLPMSYSYGLSIINSHPSMAPIVPRNIPFDLLVKLLLTLSNASIFPRYAFISIPPNWEQQSNIQKRCRIFVYTV